MMRTACGIGVSLFVLSCATSPGRPTSATRDPVDRALDAMGGADKVAGIESFVAKGTAKHWEPEQSIEPDGEMRFAGDSTFTVTRSLGSGSARVEWVRQLVYPAPRQYTFTQVVTPDAGWVDGVESTANVPRHPMSSARLAAEQRELVRTSPRLIAMMSADPSKVMPVSAASGGATAIPAVRYQAGAVLFTVFFDPATGLPERIRTVDADNIQGDSNYDLVLSDWRDVGGVKLAHHQSYELNGREVVRIQYDEIRVNPAIARDAFQIPADVLAIAPKAATGYVPYQWFIRRQFIGVLVDSDEVSYDPAVSKGLRLVELSPGVAHVVGGSHNSLVVEMAGYLVVFDAPIDERQSRFTIDAAREKYGGKPVKYLVLTHHHMDHTGGARTYVAEGATVLVGAGDGSHFAKVFSAPHTVDGDALQKNPRKADIEEIADRKIIADGSRKLEIVRFDNPHVDGMLMGYVPDARVGFVADLWSPGRDKLGDVLTPGQASVVAAVEKLSSTPERFAGGHGSVADYAQLASRAVSTPRAPAALSPAPASAQPMGTGSRP